MSKKNVSIRFRLILAFTILGFIAISVLIAAVYQLRQTQGSFSHYVNETAVRLILANDILDSTNARAISARNMAISSSEQEIQNENIAVKKAADKISESIRDLRAAIGTSDSSRSKERELFSKIEEIENRYSVVATEIVTSVNNGNREIAVERINKECKVLLASLIGSVNDYISHMNDKAKKEIVTAESSMTQISIWLPLISLLVIAAGFTLGYSTVNEIVSSLHKAITLAKTVSQGDLTSRIEVKRNDETGELLSALKQMNDSLINIVSNVRENSSNIVTASSEIATGNIDLSQRTEEQASNLQQTASSIEELSVSSTANTKSAVTAAELAKTASLTAQKGGHVIADVVNTMNDINTSSKRIESIIGTIDGIAFQTNILALNAAVEAARAAEHGRGFAVVASEVRTLAIRSSEAAREIKSLIVQSVEKVDSGMSQVDTAQKTMDEIVTQVSEVTKIVVQIGDSSKEQMVGIGEVSRAVSQLDQVTQQNAALVEQSAAATESLKHQAQSLMNTVDVFRL